jgi:hypothetical protein
MTITRDNHFVPRWYQKGFLEPGGATLAYMDLTPPIKVLHDGRVIRERSLFAAPPKRCFFQTDLYSTFFGTAVSDEIERRLFGDIDTRGADAVRAFEAPDPAGWHDNFVTFFEYLDIQKLRTPKGLSWLRGQYPALDQNELMREMQGIRMLHTTIWTQCVKEVVSAEDSDVKFIVTDHPVTIYNHAMPPGAPQCVYPNDPAIALKASQTLFPLSRSHCLILTNLEYAKDPSAAPTEKRTFARNFRPSIAPTDKFIRIRRLTNLEVSRINRVLKARAQRHVAAGRKEWLQPENLAVGSWADIAATLLPPRDYLWRFDSETFIGYKDGSVHYQDAFGRTEKERDALKKVPPVGEPASSDPCGCGSGQHYRLCCRSRPATLRPIWTELSIRERNICFYNGILSILKMDQGKDWAAVRRELTEEQIRDVYFLHEALWPLETDLLALLPKPDGRPRAVFTGSLHPESIAEFAMGASSYFGELIVENPFVHAGNIAEKFRPTGRPRTYHLEFLKSVTFFLSVMPVVEVGLINLIPNPWTFDYHLQRETMAMAQERTAKVPMSLRDEPRLEELVRIDQMRDMAMWPKDALEARVRKNFPDLDDEGLAEIQSGIERMKEDDPLTALQDGIFDGGEDGGQMRLMQMSPNFEMAMYLAQATGASIVTDSAVRWREILRAALRADAPPARLQRLAANIAESVFLFSDDSDRIVNLARDGVLCAYPKLFAEMFDYLGSVALRGPKPNFEEGLAARFARAHASAQKMLQKRKEPGNRGKISCLFAPAGIQNNTVNRLLLMSSSDHHMPKVPMAFYMRGPDSER